MLNQHMVALGNNRSTIRELFEYGNQRAAVVGRENVFDFSIGNPNVPAPDAVREAILAEAAGDPVSLHGYTSAQGAADARKALADDLNRRFGTSYTGDSLYLTAGAAAALSCAFQAIACPGDEFVVLAPYFPEYLMFIESGAGAKAVIVPPSIADFQIDFDALEKALNAHTKAVVVNSPNNPSGAVYSEQTVKQLAALLRDKEAQYGHPIYLVSDEPYREIVYDGVQVPFVPNYYDDTIVCYSYSKSLSLPGERIGYVLVPPQAADSADLYAAVCGAGRALGYVCAPSLFQRVAARCAGQTSDISVYQTNRDLLYEGLTSMGYSCVKPQGAFYLFPQTLEPDDRAFCERAKKYDLLVVPGADFGAPGHMRISYCVQTETIRRALPLFAELAKEYQND
ncbi:pyridoxal phosphate-dependent aminotransferase [Agathobaculum sp. Marseille-P7918]|uniref:pyridoxal phosphate-dependent aminotransferase n=1 Tax=Agathobaculum sp. Marseille-P7918 TaxID=2479843 RepID=UPI000F643478|nr:pyridoxal phosphate-dependent aminotransferase [Agathobaculum sp. Marseille-P7918]